MILSEFEGFFMLSLLLRVALSEFGTFILELEVVLIPWPWLIKPHCTSTL